MNLIEDIIQEALTEKKLLAVGIKDVIWEKRIIGFVVSYVPQQTISLQVINPNGKILSTKEIKIKQISFADCGGSYNERLGKIVKANIGISKGTSLVPGAKNFSVGIKQLLEHSRVATFIFDDQYVTGILRFYDDTFISIDGVSFYGPIDGISAYRMKNLTRIRYNSTNELQIEVMMKDVS